MEQITKMDKCDEKIDVHVWMDGLVDGCKHVKIYIVLDVHTLNSLLYKCMCQYSCFTFYVLIHIDVILVT